MTYFPTDALSAVFSKYENNRKTKATPGLFLLDLGENK